MARRHFRLALLAGLVAASLAGCDPMHRQNVRTPVDDFVSEPPSESAVSTPPESRGFFKKNISSGGWSSQAREIEKDLGAIN